MHFGLGFRLRHGHGYWRYMPAELWPDLSALGLPGSTRRALDAPNEPPDQLVCGVRRAYFGGRLLLPTGTMALARDGDELIIRYAYRSWSRGIGLLVWLGLWIAILTSPYGGFTYTWYWMAMLWMGINSVIAFFEPILAPENRGNVFAPLVFARDARPRHVLSYVERGRGLTVSFSDGLQLPSTGERVTTVLVPLAPGTSRDLAALLEWRMTPEPRMSVAEANAGFDARARAARQANSPFA